MSQARLEITGAPFALLDFAWVGLPVAAAGLLWLVFAAPRLLERAGDRSPAPGAATDRGFVTELRIEPGSPLAGLRRVEAARTWDLRIHSVLRGDRFVFGREEETLLQAGDVLVAEARKTVWTRLLEDARLGQLPASPGTSRQEAVVMPDSTLVGSPAGLVHGFTARGITVVAVAPRPRRIEGRLADLPLAVGDVLVLDGDPELLAAAMDDSDIMALSTPPRPESLRGEIVPLAVLGVALALAAADLLRPEIALGLGVLGLMVLGRLSLRTALADINWPIVVMLAAMIPLGTAVETTGAAAMLGDWIVGVAAPAPPLVLIGAILLLAVVLTPFVNNVATAVVLAPVAIETAHAAGLPPDPFLIAVALGASLDFLTPFGHHNNTLAMGVGGYRFADFPRVGAPLVLIAMAVGLAAIALFWLH